MSDWVGAFFAILVFAGLFFVGFVPLLGCIRIRKNGARTKAKITNVVQTKKPGTRSPGEYSAQIKFKTEKGRTITRSYYSSGDYLTLFQQTGKDEADVVYSIKNPAKFYLPKDKGDIGINIIFSVGGLVGVVAIILIFAI